MVTEQPNVLVDALLRPHRDDARPFVHLPDGTTVSHAEFTAQASRLAYALVSAGLRPGDRIVVRVGKSWRTLALYAACLMAGVVCVPVNPAYTTPEIAYFVGDCGARMLVCDEDVRDEMRAVADRHGAALTTATADGRGSLCIAAEGMEADFDPVPRAGGDLAAILYTSGTTGRSKGAMLTHDNLLSNARALAELWRFGPDDVLLHALPIFHTHGLFVATNVVLATGGAMVLLPRFDADAVMEAMPRATAMMGVPTFYARLLEHEGLTPEATAHMRLFVSGSAPLRPETHEAWERRTGHRILERYGMTETNMITSNPYEGERRAGTVGMPLPGVDVRVTGEDGAALPEGDIGMVEVRGPNVFAGYWNMPEKTAAEFREDGFFVTGDLGRWGPGGYLEIVGRDKDLIISGGYNVYPREVEIVLDAVDGVAESAVIGLPDPDLGEVPVAVVAHGDGPAPEMAALEAAAEAALARYKRPRAWVMVDALPRNAMGKVQKAALRQEHAALLAGGGVSG